MCVFEHACMFVRVIVCTCDMYVCVYAGVWRIPSHAKLITVTQDERNLWFTIKLPNMAQ